MTTNAILEEIKAVFTIIPTLYYRLFKCLLWKDDIDKDKEWMDILSEGEKHKVALVANVILTLFVVFMLVLI